ncbi:filamentous hemagglutinin family protein [Oxalobacteraceae bacterium GrIS 1.11]
MMSAHATMNRIYRLIWSELLGAWVAVAEHARGRGKGGRRALLAPAFATLSVLSAMAAQAAPPAPPAPNQLPTGATVVGGKVTIGQSGASMTLTQGTARGAIDWQTFNLGAQARINFKQPSAASVTLNRVLDAQPSQIFGQITANGQVFLSNPNGVYFSPSATVDVAGLVATTHAISNADFMAGMNTFTRDGASGAVVNEGNLTAALGGYIALLAPRVRNDGVIVARAGTVALASGEAIKLQFDDSNTLAGVIVTPSAIAALVENRLAVLAPGGLIILSAQAGNRLLGGVVNNSGSLEATGLTRDGGRVMLGASDHISDSGTIRADAAPGGNGKGGTVSLIADLANPASLSEVNGAISARGGAAGGDGGFVETSGSHLKIGDATRVDARAAAGKAGRWLLDPDGFTIAASGGDISGATLSGNLGTADVAIASTGGAGTGGNVNVNDTVSWSAHKLTLTATNDVNINAVMTASGAASLDLEPASLMVNAAFGPSNTFKGKINFTGSGVLTVNTHDYTVIHSLGSGPDDNTVGTLQGAQLSQNVYYALGGDIDASATSSWNNGSGRTGFTPFGISGSGFEGLGHVISNLTINQSGPAFITSLYSNTTVQLRNLGLVGGTVTRGTNAAGMVGINYGIISNAFSTMAVTGFDQMGGLVGENRAGIINNSYATGNVSGTSQVGGLVGKNSGIIEKSYATGNVTGTTAFIGGLAGLNYFGTISNTYATGVVSGSQSVGGLVGINQEAGGDGSTITNSYARGAVSGATNVGGLVGENGSNINNSYATGLVAIIGDGTTVGGLVGKADVDGITPISVITHSFWDTQTSGQAASAGGTGKTTADMKTQTTFTGASWDFAAPIWRIKSAVNDGYPCLASFAACPSVNPLSLRVTGASSNVYGDAVGSFSYALYDGATLLDATSETALGISVSGSSLFSGAPTSASNAGHYQIVYASGLTLGGANAADYAFAPDAGLSYTVLKRPLLLTGTRIYNGGSVAAVATLHASNLVGTDCAGGLDACGMGGSGSVASKNVSAGAQTLVVGALTLGSSDLDANYTLTGASGTYSITPRAIGIVSSGTSRVYNGALPALVTLNPDDAKVFGDDLTLSYSAANFIDKNVGTGKTINVTGIALGGVDAGNYSIDGGPTTTTHADITRRPITVFAHGVNRVYNGALSDNVTLSLDDSLVFGDHLTPSQAASNFADKNVGTGKTVTVTGITLSGTDAGNYSIENAGAMATTQADITRRPITVFATGVNRVYNGALSDNVTLSLDDSLVFGDALTPNRTASNFADKNVGTGKTVTVTGITLSGDSAGNYSVANADATATTHADITRRPITVFANGVNRVYNGALGDDVTLSLDDSLVFGDHLTPSQAASNFADKNVGTGKTVTVTGITLSGTDAGNYSVENVGAMATTHADITRRPITVFANGVNRVYNGALSDNVTLSLDDSLVFGDALTPNRTAANFADKNVGTGKTVTVTGITLSGVSAGNYSVANADAMVTTHADITRRPITVFATGVSRVYNGALGDDVTLSLDDSLVFGDHLTPSQAAANFADKNVGTGKTVTVTGITLSGDSAGNYSVANADATATTHADITRRPITVFATGVNRVYDGMLGDNVTLSLDDSLVSGDHLTPSQAAANFADKNVGTGKTVTVTGITLSGDSAGNYSVENAGAMATTHADITRRPITVFANGVNRVYNGALGDDVTLSLDDSLVFGDALTPNRTAANFADKNVGTGKTVTVTGITLSGDSAGNYSVENAGAMATTHADITRRPITVFANGVNRVYNGALGDDVTLSLDDSLVFGDALTPNRTAANFADKNVGTGKTVTVTGITLSGDSAGNYSVENAGATATTHADITRRPITVLATGVNRVYNGALADDVTLSLDDSLVFGDALTPNRTAANFADKNVGTGKTVTVTGISLSGGDAGNYSVGNEGATATTHADITRRPITVFATGVNRVYNGALGDDVTLALDDSLVGGDHLTPNRAAANFADKNVGVNKTVAVTGITLSGDDAGNYSVENAGGMATARADITPRALFVLANGVNRVYNGGVNADVALSADESLVAGDTLLLSSAPATFADKNVGAGKTINVGGIGISGADAANYSLESSTATAHAAITPRPLNVSATGVNRVYDGSTNGSAVLADNRVDGDSLSVADGAVQFADKNAGAGKALTVSGIVVGGADAANYTFNTTASTSADITRRALEVGATGINRVYDGSTSASVILADNRVAGDLLSVSGAASFADKNAGPGKPVGVSGIALSGADAGNYVANGTAATTADITPRALTVGASGIDRLFDGGTVASVALHDNRVGGDVLTLADAAASFADAAAGAAKPVSVVGISVAGVDAANYSLQNTSAATTANIVAVETVTSQVPQLPVIAPVVPVTTRVPSPLTLSTPVTVAVVATTVADAPATAAISVSLVRPSSGTVSGIVTVSIPKDMVSKGQGFSFPLPASVTAALAVGGATVRVTRVDDSPLPAWLKYNGQTHAFDVSAAPAGSLPFEVKIMVDGQRWTVVLAESTGK